MKINPLRILLLTSVVVPLLVFAAVSWRSYNTTLLSAEVEIRNTVRLLEEHARRLFEAQELILDLADARAASMSWTEIARSAALHESLKAIVETTDHVSGIWLFNPDGIAVNSGTAFPLAVSGRDRDYFAAQRDRDALYFGSLIYGKIGGNLTFNISRRRGSPTDVFDGLILVSSNISYFEDFWRDVETKRPHVADLIRSDGEVLASYPKLASLPPPLPASSNLLQAIMSADRGVYRATSARDGVDRIYGYGRVGNYPLFVGFGLERKSVLAGWRADAYFNAAITLVVATLLFLLVLTAIRQNRREITINAGLRAEIERRRQAEVTIAEKERLVAELDRAQEERKAILDTMVEGLAVVDRTEKLQYMNAAGRRLLGLSPDAGNAATGKFVGRLKFRTIDGEPLPGDRLPHARVLRGDILTDLELQVVTPTRAITCVFGGAPLRDRRNAIVGAVLTFDDITERRRAEERQQLLISELNHRVRNILAVIQGMISLAGRSGGTKEDFQQILSGRVAAMARSHTRLTEESWRGASLRQTVLEELQPYGAENRAKIGAEQDFFVRPKESQSLALVFHELATNAVKYGALSVPEGGVDVAWSLAGTEDDRVLRIEWREENGPPVQEPTRRGFGSTLIERAFPQEAAARASLSYDPDGLRCRIELPVASIVAIASVPPASAAPAPPEDDDGAPNALSGKRLLVVEDEILVAIDIEEMLKKAGSAVVGPAATLSRALSLAKVETLDAAVIDLNLGGESSAPLIDLLIERGVPLLLISGYDDPSSLPARHQHLPRLQKPFRTSALLTRLAALLSGS